MNEPCSARWDVQERGLVRTDRGVEAHEDLVLVCPECGFRVNWSVAREEWERRKA